MSEVAIDFGTSNTVLARYNETTRRAETIRVPEISAEMRYRLTAGGGEHAVWVIPSMIHYAEKETLIGDQVVSRGLAEHKDTMRWMKRSIAQGIARRKKTAQGHKSPAEAGEDFLRQTLNYASDQVSFAEDTFTFTVPVEAFENFQDWVWRVAEGLGIRKLRILDEPTACVFGYHGAARQDERFVVFDFGGGTLDVSAVRLDLSGQSDTKAVQLGQAGYDLGGMDIDQWIAADFCARHRIDGDVRRDLDNLILRQAEAVKIALSDPKEEEASMNVLNDLGRVPRIHETAYRRSCPECQGRAGRYPDAGEACLGCLLVAQEFPKRVRETLERALENAAIKSGMRRSEVTRLLVTGGASLTPAVRTLLEEAFGDRVVYDHPFDCVVRGACRGVVLPILQHDYAIVSYVAAKKQNEFKPLFKIGTEYPTLEEAVRFWCNGSTDGQTRVGLSIYEVSRMKKRRMDGALVDKDGRLQAGARVTTDYEHICLNPDNPTFINAYPPIALERDKKRFLCSFEIDGNRRLLVTVVDQLTGKTVLSKHPVVRL
ncbi:MAG: Hsp70 family protein [Acidobacteria bacterium]|nr:Hsp70 family protein [Acidobacteriota bacterium]MBI3656839.1 Hsp70 family protein [Acidobacteriota bacterium]